MRSLLRVFPVALVVSVAFVAGCSHASAPGDAGGDDTPDAGGADSTVGVPDAGADEGADVEAGPPQTFVRFAQLSPDAPAMDFCLAPHGTTKFEGPVLGQFESDAGLLTDGAAPGLSYPQVSTYVALAPGRYDVRVVAGGAASCIAAVLDAGGDGGDGGEIDGGSVLHVPDATALPALVNGAYSTILAVGDVSPAGKDASFHLTAIVDDATYPTVANGGLALRAVNALPGVPSADFGFGSFAGGWLPLFVDVALGGASLQAAPSQGVVDAQGYLGVGAVTAQVLSVRPSTGATTDTAVAHDATIGSGSIATVVAIGGKTGDASHPPSLLLCVDNSGAGALLSDCSLLQ